MGKYSEKVAEREFKKQNQLEDDAALKTRSIVILLGLVIPPIIGLAWAIPVFIHLKKRHKKRTAEERKL